MPFRIIRNDITKVHADAIVNTANPRPVIGGGTDGAIYAAAGAEALLAERRRIGDIAPGCVFHTGAYNLDARCIIHTVGPSWIDGEHGERDVLRACYRNALALADHLKCESIAFPLLATGVYGFPRDEALNIALSEIGKFLLLHEMDVILVVFDRKSFALSRSLAGEIEQYIDEHATQRLQAVEYDGYDTRNARLRELRQRELQRAAEKIAASSAPPPGLPDLSDKGLEDVLGEAGKSFQQRLFELIDRSGLDDVTVYKRANIQRQVFSSIRCKPGYKPKKRTALALAIALELDLPTTVDLLARAELALSPSSPGDLIVQYFITHGNYNICEINAALFDFDQPTLGA